MIRIGMKAIPPEAPCSANIKYKVTNASAILKAAPACVRLFQKFTDFFYRLLQEFTDWNTTSFLEQPELFLQ